MPKSQEPSGERKAVVVFEAEIRLLVADGQTMAATEQLVQERIGMTELQEAREAVAEAEAVQRMTHTELRGASPIPSTLTLLTVAVTKLVEIEEKHLAALGFIHGDRDE